MKISELSVKAVTIGALTDIIGSAFAAIVIGIAVGLYAVVTGDKSTAHIVTLAQSLPVQIVGFIVGSLFSVLGGYLAALIAKKSPYPNALAVGIVSLLTGIIPGLLAPEKFTEFAYLLACIFCVPAALLGGYLYARSASPK